ncbi:unnamed protein product, partial [Mesorhabditis belari]|uniref:Ubiquitin-like domain-containing protein n=1 Tax=Mesorhabditis belari TaxID=2138241 RepID=A0AAF3FBA8_9BILA
MKIQVKDYVFGLIPVTKELEVEKWTTIEEVKKKTSSSIVPDLSDLFNFGKSNELSGGGFFTGQPVMATFWGGNVYGDKRTLETCGICDGDLIDLTKY